MWALWKIEYNSIQRQLNFHLQSELKSCKNVFLILLNLLIAKFSSKEFLLRRYVGSNRNANNNNGIAVKFCKPGYAWIVCKLYLYVLYVCVEVRKNSIKFSLIFLMFYWNLCFVGNVVFLTLITYELCKSYLCIVLFFLLMVFTDFHVAVGVVPLHTLPSSFPSSSSTLQSCGNAKLCMCAPLPRIALLCYFAIIRLLDCLRFSMPAG